MVASQIVTIVMTAVKQTASTVVVFAPREVNLSMESAKRYNAFPIIIANVRMEKNSFA